MTRKQSKRDITPEAWWEPALREFFSKTCMPLREVKRIHFEESLKNNSGNRANTAQELGISLRGCFNLIKKYGLQNATYEETQDQASN